MGDSEMMMAPGAVARMPSLEGLGLAVNKRRRKSTSAASSQKEVAEGAGSAEKQNAVARERKITGTTCFPCGGRDDSQDPVFPNELLYWAYPLKKDGTVDGEWCQWCMKTFNKCFKSTFNNVKNFKANYGTEKDKFTTLRAVTVEVVKENGNPSCKLKSAVANAKYADAVKSCDFKEVKESFMAEPEDALWGLDEYHNAHGDYRANGLGHVNGVVLYWPSLIMLITSGGSLVCQRVPSCFSGLLQVSLRPFVGPTSKTWDSLKASRVQKVSLRFHMAPTMIPSL
jgi:hypothetical protein